MTSRCDARALVAALALMLAMLAAACGRTDGYPPCPAGFGQDPSTGACTCTSDAVCPTGYLCDSGACRCDGDACCPPGHRHFAATATAAERCECRSDACCPEGTTFVEETATCACTSDTCCPEGHTWDEATRSCACTSDACCPDGFTFDAARASCVCASDACCPAGFIFDPVGNGCSCGEDACCPEGNAFDPVARACICTGVGCCPAGFAQDAEGRCVCTTNSACPAGLRCDIPTGRCLCTGDEDCAGGSFCNRFGFCQSLEGCRGNDDCPSDRFCDLTGGRCRLRGECGSDVHCPLGQICANNQCVSGCRATADCNFDDVCIDSRCRAGRCEDSSYCSLGAFCDAARQSCGPRDDRYCRPCEFGCTDGPCLVTIIEGKGITFCGVPCTEDTDCPGGMDCANSFTNCGGPGGGCPGNLICLETQVLNQVGTSFLCADPNTRRVAPTGQFCGPRERRCE